MYDEELKVFLEALPEYYEHIKTNPSSLIARIYGVFKVKMEDIVPVNLLVMANTIQCKSSQQIMNVFDLKGSVVNREVTITKSTKNTTTLKDLNLQIIKKKQQFLNNDIIKFKRKDIELINDQLKKDVELFKQFNIMDYSLLLAIEKIESGHIVREKSFNKTERRHSFVSSCGSFIYHVAIIDYLQTFNF